MNNNLTFSDNCVNLITTSEGFVPHPYVDPASGGEPITIGYGSTHYCDGTKVTLQDTPVTEEAGMELLKCFLNKSVLPKVHTLVTADINQNQLDAIGDFCYNLGSGNFASSTLLKKINANPNDPSIKAEFSKWNKAAGKVLTGLTIRRNKEATLYFS